MKVKVIKTVRGMAPMQEASIRPISDDSTEMQVIDIVPAVTYQEVGGFGGAFTEASASVLAALPSETRAEIIKLYFDEKDGIGYNFGRVHLNSCDFALDSYTCVDENDTSLRSFRIERDKKAVIPLIKDALQYGAIKLLVSPWSPPAFMKTNGKMTGGGKLRRRYYKLWAEYYVKFIEAYRHEGVDIWGVTVQNEPNAAQRWESCLFSAEEERDFVRDHLGKKMRHMHVKLLFWDHNKERIYDRARVMLADKAAAQYIYGIAFHWYSGDHFSQLSMFHELYPDKKLVFSEGCCEYTRYAAQQADTTRFGEKYAHEIIGDFNNFCNFFCDWNIVLDTHGGPNHADNFCDAPVMVDTARGAFSLHASYYYIGHFSKYVKPGAVRIGSSKWTQEIETVAFRNPNGEIVSVVLNASDKELPFFFRINGYTVPSAAPAHSIYTYIFTDTKEETPKKPFYKSLKNLLGQKK